LGFEDNLPVPGHAPEHFTKSHGCRPRGISAKLEGGLTRVESLFWTDQDSAFEVVRDLIEDILSEGATGVVVESATEWITKTTDRRTRTMADLLNGIALLDELLVQL